MFDCRKKPQNWKINQISNFTYQISKKNSTHNTHYICAKQSTLAWLKHKHNDEPRAVTWTTWNFSMLNSFWGIAVILSRRCVEKWARHSTAFMLSVCCFPCMLWFGSIEFGKFDRLIQGGVYLCDKQASIFRKKKLFLPNFCLEFGYLGSLVHCGLHPLLHSKNKAPRQEQHHKVHNSCHNDFWLDPNFW